MSFIFFVGYLKGFFVATNMRFHMPTYQGDAHQQISTSRVPPPSMGAEFFRDSNEGHKRHSSRSWAQIPFVNGVKEPL